MWLFCPKERTISCTFSVTLLERNLVVHVSGRVDTILRELGKLDLEALLNRLEDGLVIGAAHERDTETLGSETTGTTDTVEVGIGLVGHVVVDGHVDALDIDTTTEDVSGNTDTRLELFELLVTLDTIGELALK
jgi:hypothetical protein